MEGKECKNTVFEGLISMETILPVSTVEPFQFEILHKLISDLVQVFVPEASPWP